MMPRGGLRSNARTRHRRANAGADAQKSTWRIAYGEKKHEGLIEKQHMANGQ